MKIKFIILFIFTSILTFGQNRDLIKFQGENGLYGYKDSNDVVIFEPIFVHASLFNSSGLAYVYIKDKGWTYADSRGYIIKEPVGEFGTPYGDYSYDLIRHSMDNKWGYIDRNGKVIIGYQYEETKDFNEGIAPVRINEKWGLIDTANQLIVPAKFENIATCSDGYLAVLVDSVWGFIDKTGEIVIEPKYKSVYRFTEGLCAVNTLPFQMANGGIATEVIDKMGNTKFTGMFYFFQPYKNGIASYWEGYDMSGRHIFIDKNGKETRKK